MGMVFMSLIGSTSADFGSPFPLASKKSHVFCSDLPDMILNLIKFMCWLYFLISSAFLDFHSLYREQRRDEAA